MLGRDCRVMCVSDVACSQCSQGMPGLSVTAFFFAVRILCLHAGPWAGTFRVANGIDDDILGCTT